MDFPVPTAPETAHPPRPHTIEDVHPAPAYRKHRTPRPARNTLPGARLQAVRFALDAPVLPPATLALPLAEEARRRAIAAHARRTAKLLYGDAFDHQRFRAGQLPVWLSPVLAGKDASGARRIDDHRHAYYLLADEDGDGRLDHLTITAKEGFDLLELDALRSLHQLTSAIDVTCRPVRLLLMGLSTLDELSPRIRGPAHAWVSATPYVCTRFPKPRGRHRDPPELLRHPLLFMQHDLHAEVCRWLQRSHSQARILDIQPLTDPNGAFLLRPQSWNATADGPPLRPTHFKRSRRKHTDDGGRRYTGAFLILFDRPVTGPIALGHSSHFSLGLLLPCANVQHLPPNGPYANHIPIHNF